MILNNIPSLSYFCAEIVITLGILILLVISVFKDMSEKSFYITIGTIVIAFLFVLGVFNQYNILFLGNIVIDPYSNFFKLIFLFTTLIVAILSYYDKDVERSDWPEYFSLLLIVVEPLATTTYIFLPFFNSNSNSFFCAPFTRYKLAS